MKTTKTLLVVVVLLASLFVMAEDVQARRYRGHSYRFGGARPATGYGANLHRRFILKQESRRASQGKRVRNRGNILWIR